MTSAGGAAHYDRVTEVWEKYVMGPELHFGYFESPDDDLATAASELTTLMAEESNLQPGLQVLDVGCGVGTPARRLAAEFGCEVTGISNSRVGVELARARADVEGVRFEVTDAMDNGLPDGSFDRVWALESIHVMPDLARVFSECARVLRPGGRIALCDIVTFGTADPYAAHLRQYREAGHSDEVCRRMYDATNELQRRAFGTGGAAPLAAYETQLASAGFTDVQANDLSEPTRPTIERWCKNAHDHAEAITEAVGAAYLHDFFYACKQMSSGWGFSIGYVVMTAVKPL